MRVRAIGWMGVQTPEFDAMNGFLEALVGAPPPKVEPGLHVWTLPSGALVELFAPGQKPQFGSGPVVGFFVDDLAESQAALEAAGGKVVGGYGPNEDGYTAVHVRAPDGNVYEIIHDPLLESRARS